jgi:hypothetical protein
MNTPIGRAQTFMIPSSVGDLRSSASCNLPRDRLKKSASTENITNNLLNSDSPDAPGTLIKPYQKGFREIGSDERKIISGFLSTPLLVIKTPGSSSKSEIFRSPLQKMNTKKYSASSNLGLFITSESSGGLLAKETSSIELEFNSSKSEKSIVIDDSYKNLAQIPKPDSADKQVESKVAKPKTIARPSILPIKSVKPVTVPKEFALSCGERALQKRLMHSKPFTTPLEQAKLVNQPPSQFKKFTPTIPKSPLFASKLKSLSRIKENLNRNDLKSSNSGNDHGKIADLRRRLEYQPPGRKPGNKVKSFPSK